MEIHDLAFYDELKGFLTYGQMPFGLTGAPTCFNEMTISTLLTFAHYWTEYMTESCHSQPTRPNYSEAVFTGATVGPDSIKPDLTKLTAIIDWQQPTDLSGLESFLGLTGRDLIQDYSRIAAPLTNLKRENIPNNIGKAAYQREMHAYKLQG